MKKKLLILGAGIYQVPLIETAKRMGLETIVASIPGNYPGFALADKVVYENTVDKEAMLALAKAEQVGWGLRVRHRCLRACPGVCVRSVGAERPQRGGGGTCPGQGADEGGL